MTRPPPTPGARSRKTPVQRPLLALRSTLLLPGQTIAVQMGAPHNVALARGLSIPGAEVVVAWERKADGGESGERGEGGEGGERTGDSATHEGDNEAWLGRIGILCRARDRSEPTSETVQLTLHALRRVHIDAVDTDGAYPVVDSSDATESVTDDFAARDLAASVLAAVDEMVEGGISLDSAIVPVLRSQRDVPARLADLAAAHLGFRVEDCDEVVQMLDVIERLRFVLARVEREAARAHVTADVGRRARKLVEGHQREFFLRQQLRTIQAELGEQDPAQRDADELDRRIEEAKLPDAVLRESRREAERLRALPPSSSEHQVLRSYLDWVLAMPWTRTSGSTISLEEVDQALDTQHWGLREAKERILEHLAVRQLRGGEPTGPILCFAGPPGTGKTSLGEVIAAAMGRAFDRFSVGGVRDEAEIRGHRRTYVGAMPGRIAQSLRRAAVRDPVLMIDEIDKMDQEDRRGIPPRQCSKSSIRHTIMRSPITT